jgi:hypothetical protein
MTLGIHRSIVSLLTAFTSFAPPYCLTRSALNRQVRQAEGLRGSNAHTARTSYCGVICASGRTATPPRLLAAPDTPDTHTTSDRPSADLRRSRFLERSHCEPRQDPSGWRCAASPCRAARFHQPRSAPHCFPGLGSALPPHTDAQGLTGNLTRNNKSYWWPGNRSSASGSVSRRMSSCPVAVFSYKVPHSGQRTRIRNRRSSEPICSRW